LMMFSDPVQDPGTETNERKMQENLSAVALEMRE
jgi:hypothetical protein